MAAIGAKALADKAAAASPAAAAASPAAAASDSVSLADTGTTDMASAASEGVPDAEAGLADDGPSAPSNVVALTADALLALEATVVTQQAALQADLATLAVAHRANHFLGFSLPGLALGFILTSYHSSS